MPRLSSRQHPHSSAWTNSIIDDTILPVKCWLPLASLPAILRFIQFQYSTHYYTCQALAFGEGEEEGNLKVV